MKEIFISARELNSELAKYREGWEILQAIINGDYKLQGATGVKIMLKEQDGDT